MESLDDVLLRIRILEKDLYAVIVLQETEWHWQAADLPHQFPGDNDSITTFPVTDKPRITEPDIKKREDARAQLQRVYDSSEWYSGRYEAGKGLDIDEKVLEDKSMGWIEELRNRMYDLIAATNDECFIPGGRGSFDFGQLYIDLK